MRRVLVLAALLVVLPALCLALDVAGIRLPGSEAVAGQTLRLNGAGVRTRFGLFKVYVIGLYLEDPSHSAASIVGSPTIRRLELHMLRAVEGEELGRAVKEVFERNAKADMPRLRERLGRFIGMFPALKAGDVVTLTAVPGRGTLVAIDSSEAGTIEGDDFAAALLAVWLGDRPVDARLKAALLGQ